MACCESQRWRSEETLAWLRVHGLHSIPRTIKAEIGDLVYNRDRSGASNEMGSLLDFDLCQGDDLCRQCPVGKIGNACPCISQGLVFLPLQAAAMCEMVEYEVNDDRSTTYMATPIAVAVREAVSPHANLVHLLCNLVEFSFHRVFVQF